MPTVTPIAPSEPEEVVTNLGSASYDPNNVSTTYVSVLVAGEAVDPKNATSVKLFIPSGATEGPVVFLISAFSSDAETAAGQFVAKDGRIAISPPPLSIKPRIQTQIVSTGGSGQGPVTFISRTLNVCSITPSGLLVGKLEGKCTVAARKASSGIFADTISSSVSLFIQHKSIASGHPAGDPNHSILCQEISY